MGAEIFGAGVKLNRTIAQTASKQLLYNRRLSFYLILRCNEMGLSVVRVGGVLSFTT